MKDNTLSKPQKNKGYVKKAMNCKQTVQKQTKKDRKKYAGRSRLFANHTVHAL